MSDDNSEDFTPSVAETKKQPQKPITPPSSSSSLKNLSQSPTSKPHFINGKKPILIDDYHKTPKEEEKIGMQETIFFNLIPSK